MPWSCHLHCLAADGLAHWPNTKLLTKPGDTQVREMNAANRLVAAAVRSDRLTVFKATLVRSVVGSSP